jgi:purine-binding chemotaxis protein CheW
MRPKSPEIPPGGDPAAGGPDGVLAFTIDGREFGVPIGAVVEIIRHRVATPVPRARPAVEGILALRGWIVTVVDVRRGLGLKPRQPGSTAQVIVMESAGDRLGLVVDSVTRVERPPRGITILDLDAVLKEIS